MFILKTDPFESSRIPCLDGMRAIFVLFVILGHAGLPFPSGLGVTGFFVLSGFLITFLLLKENQRYGNVSIKEFYCRRSLRIFPAYYTFICFSFVLDNYKGDIWSVEQLLSAIFYVVNYFNAINNHPTSSIAHAWSLAVEEQFYMVWPFAFLAMCNNRKLVFGGLFLILAWRSLAYLIVFDQATAWVYNALDCRFDSLLIGSAFAYLIYEKSVYIKKIKAAPFWLPVVLFALAVLSAQVELWHYTLGFTVEAVLFALIIVQIVYFSSHPMWKWLEWRLFIWLGMLSYSMYLYHSWGLALGKRLIDFFLLDIFLGVLFTVLFAVASYYFIERPTLILKKRIKMR